MSDQLV